MQSASVIYIGCDIAENFSAPKTLLLIQKGLFERSRILIYPHNIAWWLDIRSQDFHRGLVEEACLFANKSPCGSVKQYLRPILKIRDEGGNPYFDLQQSIDTWVRVFADIETRQEVAPDTLANIVIHDTVQAVSTHVLRPLSDICLALKLKIVRPRDVRRHRPTTSRSIYWDLSAHGVPCLSLSSFWKPPCTLLRQYSGGPFLESM